MESKPWHQRYGLDELAQKIGKGSAIGASAAAGIALLALFSGVGSSFGWLAWLAVPVVAVAGGLVGDYLRKDGPVFGEHGVVAAFSNHYKPKTIPEGYIAANPSADVSAVDSATLAKHGHVHTSGLKLYAQDEMALGYYEQRHLDPYVEFNIKGDPRLDALIEKAKQYGKLYADISSKDYIPDVRGREKKITTLIIDDVGNTYGKYSMDVLEDSTHNSAEYEALHHPKRWILGSKTVELKEMKRGELVCRHYAPIMSVLLNEASVPNHLVSSLVGNVRNGEGQFSLESYKPFGESQVVSPHAYVITTQGNSVVEGTVAGQTYAHKKVYRPILNGVSVEDIVFKGRVAITDIPEGERGFIYGGHSGAGGAEYSGSEAYHGCVRKIMEDTLEGYNAKVQAKRAADAINLKGEIQEATDKQSYLVLPPSSIQQTRSMHC